MTKSGGEIWYGARQHASRMGKYTTAVERRFIRRMLMRENGPLRILDVGGGEGVHSVDMREMGHKPIVLERDSKPIGTLIERHPDIPVVQADAMTLPIAAGSVDAVLTIEVSICTTGVDNHNVTYFAEVSRILKNGGLFIFTAFNQRSYFGLLNRFRGRRPSFEGYYYSESIARYRSKLRDAGFEIIEIRGFRWPPFTRSSNSRLVPVASFLESLFLLRYATGLSPWLCLAARKRTGRGERI